MTTPEEYPFVRLSASEVACYRWPDDTPEHQAMRAAFMAGAASATTPEDAIQAERDERRRAFGPFPWEDKFVSEAYHYACRLAVALWEKHYKQAAPEWQPRTDMIGLLTQIDNMVAGMVRIAQDPSGADGVAAYERGFKDGVVAGAEK